MKTLLIGPRACGKTTVGRLLAAQLRACFVDLDDRTLARFAEKSIQEVWRVHGESAWRNAESQAVEEVLKSDCQVIALGGGTPLIESAQVKINELRQAGLVRVVYLSCPPHVLVERLQFSPGDRPSLTGANLLEEVSTVLSQRVPVYRALADLTIDVTSASPHEVVNELSKRCPDDHQP